MSNETDGSIKALTTIFNEVRDLLRSILQTSNASSASTAALEKLLFRLTDNQKSGKTDELNTATLHRAQIEARLEKIESSQEMVEANQIEVANRVWTLTRQVQEIYDWSMPLWTRLLRRIKARRDWVEGGKK